MTTIFVLEHVEEGAELRIMQDDAAGLLVNVTAGAASAVMALHVEEAAILAAWLADWLPAAETPATSIPIDR